MTTTNTANNETANKMIDSVMGEHTRGYSRWVGIAASVATAGLAVMKGVNPIAAGVGAVAGSGTSYLLGSTLDVIPMSTGNNIAAAALVGGLGMTVTLQSTVIAGLLIPQSEEPKADKSFDNNEIEVL